MTVRVRRWSGADGRVRETFEVDIKFAHPDGSIQRVKKKSPVQTRRGAERYERETRQALLDGTYGMKATPTKALPTIAEFAEKFLTYSKVNNKPSSLAAKQQVLRTHLLPEFGNTRLDEIGPYEIEAFKAKKIEQGLSHKTINNVLTVLGRMFSLAVEWKVLERVPPMKWMKSPRPEFDFLTFDEADRLVAAAEPGWRQTMIMLALNTGLRRGELMALQWDDVDLVSGRLMIRRNVWLKHYGTPKGGRSREIPLNQTALAQLKTHRHLRGALVLCKDDGKPVSNQMCWAAIIRACKRAGLRQVGWHVLRHTFASQLVMRGVPLKVVQELLGHATVEMTLRYAHLSPDVKNDAVKVLDRTTESRLTKVNAPPSTQTHDGPN